MYEELKAKDISLILIQIDEAHSSGWPVGLDNQPEPQKNIEERKQRAIEFIEKYNSPYPVYVDGWDNVFAETFRAWPDKFYYVDKNKVVLAKSEYGREGDDDAKIVEDYSIIMEGLINL